MKPIGYWSFSEVVLFKHNLDFLLRFSLCWTALIEKSGC